MVIRYTFII